MIVLLISTTIVPIVEDLNDTEFIENTNNTLSTYAPYAKIEKGGTYNLIMNPSASASWEINDEDYQNDLAVISENLIAYAGYGDNKGICFKDTSGHWVKIWSNFAFNITDGTATVVYNSQTTYTIDVSDGYIINPDGDYRLADPGSDETHISTLSNESLIGIGEIGGNVGIGKLAYVEFIGTDIIQSISCVITGNTNLSTNFEFNTVESINDNDAYTFEHMDGYTSYTFFEKDIDITTSADYGISLEWVLYPTSITVDRTLEGPEYDMIRILPVIMIAGVVIASIGAFVISRRE